MLGPTEITVFNPEIFSLTDGPGNKCKKAVWYDFLLPEVAVNTTRDKQLHDRRRRIWDKAFTPKGIIKRSITSNNSFKEGNGT